MSSRPPADIAPEAFFTTWLPAQVDRARAAASASPLVLRVRLDGEGGGAWDLQVGADGLAVSVADGDDAGADLLLAQSVADWRAVVVGEAGAPALVPGSAQVADLFAGGALAQVQAQAALLKGTLRLELGGFGASARTWALVVRFGKQATVVPADTTIRTDAATYAEIQRGELAPAQAFFAGKVLIEGNAGLAMQVGMAFAPRA
jgi:putative sterol carrier protein